MYGHNRAYDLVGSRLGDFGVVSHPATSVSLRKLFRSDYRLRDLRSQKTEADGANRYFSSNLLGIVVNQTLLRVWGVQTDQTDQRMAGLALERSEQQLRLLSAHLQSLREKERSELAQELHDHLGQALTSIKVDISLVQKILITENQTAIAQAKEKLTEMNEILSDTISAVKSLSTELRPAVLDKFGLKAAIEWQCVEFTRRFGIECEFRASRKHSTISPAISISLFRILQEALTNVATHSQAKHVKVRLSARKSTISLSVSDNGRGITVEESNAPSSLGLLGMRERAETLDGRLSIQGKPGRTLVSVRVPLTTKAAERTETENE
jgi:signal transduction histidine kinase